MQTVPLKLLTVIAEAVLEERLLRDLREHGTKGYTLDQVRGEGSRGVHASEWEGRNIKVETIVTDEAAQSFLLHLSREYFPKYAVIAYVQDVQVVRGEKYT
jgi:nitrogen regulatory protein P-II 2